MAAILSIICATLFWVVIVNFYSSAYGFYFLVILISINYCIVMGEEKRCLLGLENLA